MTNMEHYFVELYSKTVERHRIAIRNVGICNRAINMGDKRKILKLKYNHHNVDLSSAYTQLDLLNDLLKHYPELDPNKEISEYDPSDWANNCISCVPRYMTFDWLLVQTYMEENPGVTEDKACLHILRSSDAVLKFKNENEELKRQGG